MCKKNTLSISLRLAGFLMLVGLFAFQPIPADAAKSRLSVGFTIGSSVESLGASDAWQYGTMGCIYWQLLYDALDMYGPAPEYGNIPMLSERYETEDHQTFTYHLRKDAKFHDGTPVTAHDVAFTAATLIKQEPSFQYPDTLHTATKVIDDHTFQITLEAPLGGKFPAFGWVPILPKHIWEPYKDNIHDFENAQSIGSGPYKLKEFKAGQYLWFEANKEHWGEGVFRPHIDELIFKSYGSQDALIMALKRGEIDMMGYNGISPLSIKEFENDKNVEIIVSPGIELVWMTFNMHKPMFQDLRVRQAITYALDRQQLIDLAFLGYAKPQYGFIYPDLEEHNPDLPRYDHDPEKAKALLTEAGYVDTDGDGTRNDPATGDNLELGFVVSSESTDSVKCARLIIEQLAKVGVEVSLKAVDSNTYYEFYYVPTDDQWDLGMGLEEPGPNPWWIWEFMRSYDDGGEGWNAAYYNNPEFDKVLNAYHASLDEGKRKELCHQMQQIMSDDLPYVVLLRPDMINPVRIDKLEGYTPTMGGVSTWPNVWTYFNIRPKK